MDFDARVNTLAMEIREDWEEDVKALWKKHQESVAQGLIDEFGAHELEIKRQNFIDIGDKPMSVLAFHNRFFHQIRVAFVTGAYYPALVGACALGERILNHLILTLRKHFKDSDVYKRVHRKDSFDNWNLAIDALEAWEVLLADVAAQFRELEKARHKAIHFRPEVDRNDRELALASALTVRSIIARQFGAFGNQPWFMTDTPGECFLKHSWEARPFIEEIYVPNCLFVGPRHKIVQMVPNVVI